MGWGDGTGGGRDPGALGCACLIVLLVLIAYEVGRLAVMLLTPVG